jgi:hypothetical protein
MQRATLGAVALAGALLLAGCTGVGDPAAGTPTGTEAPTRTPTVTPTRTPTATPTSTSTPATVDSLPAPSSCAADAAPRPGTVDGVAPSDYPEPPATVTGESVANWTAAFERAYFRNEMLVGAADDDEMNLTSATASTEVRRVNHTARGYVVVLSDFGATNYASGIHGDHWADVGYVVTDTCVVRVPLEDRDDPVRADGGTVVLDCG